MKTLNFCMWCNVGLTPQDIEDRRCVECHKPAVNKSDAIRTGYDLARLYGIEPSDGANWVERLSRQLYKNTACGAWVKVDAYGAQVGTIVEGSDAEILADFLKFPFTRQDWNKTVDFVEAEAAVLWAMSNEDEGTV